MHSGNVQHQWLVPVQKALRALALPPHPDTGRPEGPTGCLGGGGGGPIHTALA